MSQCGEYVALKGRKHPQSAGSTGSYDDHHIFFKIRKDQTNTMFLPKYEDSRISNMAISIVMRISKKMSQL